MAAAVREIVDFARPEIELARCTVVLHVEEDLRPALFDEAQLRQALLNLLRNAREAMPDGGPIEVRVAAEGMSVVVDVDDRGGGIPEDIRARVFDPFFSTKGEGTGLGLAITRHIVEAHGGSVTCEHARRRRARASASRSPSRRRRARGRRWRIPPPAPAPTIPRPVLRVGTAEAQRPQDREVGGREMACANDATGPVPRLALCVLCASAVHKPPTSS